MAQGLWPVFCCLSQECLLSGRKKSRELKVTLGFKGPTTAVTRGLSWLVWCSFWIVEQSSVSQTQSWEHHWLVVCWLIIYLATGPCSVPDSFLCRHLSFYIFFYSTRSLLVCIYLSLQNSAACSVISRCLNIWSYVCPSFTNSLLAWDAMTVTPWLFVWLFFSAGYNFTLYLEIYPLANLASY